MPQENLVNLILNDYDSFVEYHRENSDIEISEADFSHSTLENANFSEIDFKISELELKEAIVNQDDCTRGNDEMNTNGNTSIIGYTFELNFRGRAKETEEQGDPISNYFDHYINSSSDDYLHWQIINTGKIKNRRDS